MTRKLFPAGNSSWIFEGDYAFCSVCRRGLGARIISSQFGAPSPGNNVSPEMRLGGSTFAISLPLRNCYLNVMFAAGLCRRTGPPGAVSCE